MTSKLPRRLATVEMNDGTIFDDIRITTADTVQYELTAHVKKWPGITVRGSTGTVAGINLKECFEVWHALVRLEHYNGKFEEFWQRDVADFNVEDDEPVDPTGPATDARLILELAMQYPSLTPDWLTTASDEDLATVLDIHAAEIAAIEKARG